MPNDQHELRILEEIEWYVKRLITKGYVKVTHLQRRKLRYFLTPSGLALKVKLTRSYMDVSLRVYRELRQAARQALSEVRQAGYTAVCIEGDDQAAEILNLTCLEQNMPVNKSARVPTLRVEGTEFAIQWPDGNNRQS